MTGTEKIPVRVSRRSPLSHDVVMFELAREDGAALPPFAAGAHIDVDAGGFTRQYSLCGDPADCASYRIAVLRDARSRGGSAAMHALRQGDSIVIGAPRNLFPLVPQTEALLIAGGIGVTPLIAMAHDLDRRGISFALHHAENDGRDLPFGALFAEPPLARRVTIHRTSRAAGRPFDARSVIGSYAPGRHLYTCGPAGFMDAVTVAATSLGWPADAIHREHFDADIDTMGDAFTVVAARSGAEVTVDAGRTIAEALIDAGVEVALSCEQGVCGTCITPILEGEADHRDLYLTEAEQAEQKQIAICCSRSLRPRLVLDL